MIQLNNATTLLKPSMISPKRRNPNPSPKPPSQIPPTDTTVVAFSHPSYMHAGLTFSVVFSWKARAVFY